MIQVCVPWCCDHRAALRTFLPWPPPPNFPAGFVEHSGPEMLRIVEEAQMPSQLPPPAQRERPDPELLARVKRLGAVLQQKASELAITPEVLGTRRELEALARGNQEVDMLRGWRRTILGEALLGAIA